MPRISASFVKNQLLPRVDIVRLIQQYIALKKVGANYKCCCPFHQEKTPSFIVSPVRQTYKCFGCGKGGNAVDFVMNYKRCGFVEAVEELSRFSGITIEYENSYQSQLYKQRQEFFQPFYDLMERAALYFTEQLRNSPEAMAYCKTKRQISDELIMQARIGYAPNDFNYVQQELCKSEQDYKICKKLGLLRESSNGRRDHSFFRDRLMIPVFDVRGRVIGFGARCLVDGPNIPKYINSPESLLFKKGHELYGLYECLQATHKQPERIIVVEGYMDALLLRQFGFNNVVAALGTALTAEHFQKMFRYTREIVLCLDGDDPGKNASWRALQLVTPTLQPDTNLRVANLPATFDPDALVRAKGVEAFSAVIDKAISYSRAVILHVTRIFDNQNTSNSGGNWLPWVETLLRIVKAMPFAALQEVTLHEIISASRGRFSLQVLKSMLATTQPDPDFLPRAPAATAADADAALPQLPNPSAQPQGQAQAIHTPASHGQGPAPALQDPAPAGAPATTAGGAAMPVPAQQGQPQATAPMAPYGVQGQSQQDMAMDEPQSAYYPEQSNGGYGPQGQRGYMQQQRGYRRYPRANPNYMMQGMRPWRNDMMGMQGGMQPDFYGDEYGADPDGMMPPQGFPQYGYPPYGMPPLPRANRGYYGQGPDMYSPYGYRGQPYGGYPQRPRFNRYNQGGGYNAGFYPRGGYNGGMYGDEGYNRPPRMGFHRNYGTFDQNGVYTANPDEDFIRPQHHHNRWSYGGAPEMGGMGPIDDYFTDGRGDIAPDYPATPQLPAQQAPAYLQGQQPQPPLSPAPAPQAAATGTAPQLLAQGQGLATPNAAAGAVSPQTAAQVASQAAPAQASFATTAPAPDNSGAMAQAQGAQSATMAATAPNGATVSAGYAPAQGVTVAAPQLAASPAIATPAANTVDATMFTTGTTAATQSPMRPMGAGTLPPKVETPTTGVMTIEQLQEKAKEERLQRQMAASDNDYMQLGPDGMPSSRVVDSEDNVGEYYTGGYGPGASPNRVSPKSSSNNAEKVLDPQGVVGGVYAGQGQMVAYASNAPLTQEEYALYRTLVGMPFNEEMLSGPCYQLIAFILQQPNVVAYYYEKLHLDDFLVFAKKLRVREFPCMERLLRLICAARTTTCADLIEEYRGTVFEPLFSYLSEMHSCVSSELGVELSMESKAEILTARLIATLQEPLKVMAEIKHFSKGDRVDLKLSAALRGLATRASSDSSRSNSFSVREAFSAKTTIVTQDGLLKDADGTTLSGPTQTTDDQQQEHQEQQAQEAQQGTAATNHEAQAQPQAQGGATSAPAAMNVTEAAIKNPRNAAAAAAAIVSQNAEAEPASQPAPVPQTAPAPAAAALATPAVATEPAAAKAEVASAAEAQQASIAADASTTTPTEATEANEVAQAVVQAESQEDAEAKDEVTEDSTAQAEVAGASQASNATEGDATGSTEATEPNEVAQEVVQAENPESEEAKDEVAEVTEAQQASSATDTTAGSTEATEPNEVTQEVIQAEGAEAKDEVAEDSEAQDESVSASQASNATEGDATGSTEATEPNEVTQEVPQAESSESAVAKDELAETAEAQAESAGASLASNAAESATGSTEVTEANETAQEVVQAENTESEEAKDEVAETAEATDAFQASSATDTATSSTEATEPNEAAQDVVQAESPEGAEANAKVAEDYKAQAKAADASLASNAAESAAGSTEATEPNETAQEVVQAERPKSEEAKDEETGAAESQADSTESVGGIGLALESQEAAEGSGAGAVRMESKFSAEPIGTLELINLATAQQIGGDIADAVFDADINFEALTNAHRAGALSQKSEAKAEDDSGTATLSEEG